MVQANDDATDASSLGTGLSTLSSAADGLSSNVRTLQRAVDDLQTSTERWGERQAKASESLSHAADNLAAASVDRPDAVGDVSTDFAVADD